MKAGASGGLDGGNILFGPAGELEAAPVERGTVAAADVASAASFSCADGNPEISKKECRDV